MNCAESQLLVHAHADGELDIANSLELERHLKTCAACAAQQNSIHSLKIALHEPALRYSAPASLSEEVRRMVRAPDNESKRSIFQSLQFWRSLAFGATAFALFMILFRPGIAERNQLMNEAVNNHFRSLMVSHLTDVASSDQHTVKPWFTGKLDFAPEVKDFSAQGFPLIGGRLDYLQGHSVAALVYKRNLHSINVFVWPAANTGSGKVKAEKYRGYSVVSRETGGLHYCLVSDLNEKELAELANLFGQ